jgi:hypothetical protein
LPERSKFLSHWKSDQTIYFHNGGDLKDWKKYEIPWIEQLLWLKVALMYSLKPSDVKSKNPSL